ncbi:hypothetical protein RABR111495_07185 [Rahnella bruchi]
MASVPPGICTVTLSSTSPSLRIALAAAQLLLPEYTLNLLVAEQSGNTLMADQIIVTQTVIAVKNHVGTSFSKSCKLIIDVNSFNRKSCLFQ